MNFNDAVYVLGFLTACKITIWLLFKLFDFISDLIEMRRVYVETKIQNRINGEKRGGK